MTDEIGIPRDLKLQRMGRDKTVPPIVSKQHQPTTSDTDYKLGTFWRDSVGLKYYQLVDFSANGASWLQVNADEVSIRFKDKDGVVLQPINEEARVLGEGSTVVRIESDAIITSSPFFIILDNNDIPTGYIEATPVTQAVVKIKGVGDIETASSGEGELEIRSISAGEGRAWVDQNEEYIVNDPTLNYSQFIGVNEIIALRKQNLISNEFSQISFDILLFQSVTLDASGFQKEKVEFSREPNPSLLNTTQTITFRDNNSIIVTNDFGVLRFTSIELPARAVYDTNDELVEISDDKRSTFRQVNEVFLRRATDGSKFSIMDIGLEIFNVKLYTEFLDLKGNVQFTRSDGTQNLQLVEGSNIQYTLESGNRIKISAEPSGLPPPTLQVQLRNGVKTIPQIEIETNLGETTIDIQQLDIIVKGIETSVSSFSLILEDLEPALFDYFVTAYIVYNSLRQEYEVYNWGEFNISALLSQFVLIGCIFRGQDASETRLLNLSSPAHINMDLTYSLLCSAQPFFVKSAEIVDVQEEIFEVNNVSFTHLYQLSLTESFSLSVSVSKRMFFELYNGKYVLSDGYELPETPDDIDFDTQILWSSALFVLNLATSQLYEIFFIEPTSRSPAFSISGNQIYQDFRGQFFNNLIPVGWVIYEFDTPKESIGIHQNGMPVKTTSIKCDFGSTLLV